MTQYIITLVIVFIAFGVAFFRIVNYFRKLQKNETACGSCSSDCSSCSLVKDFPDIKV
ncbi:MAG: FeoB-associated Cys-rich membrane protein [Bacteroidota bacterium]